MNSYRQANRNAKKRLREFKINLELHIKEGKRIILKKAPTPAMLYAAKERGIDANDWYYETLSQAEIEDRNKKLREYERQQYGKQAINSKGSYKPTGEREQIDKEQKYKDDYFSLSDEDKIKAHEDRQLVRDITRGWNCPYCKLMNPELHDLPEDKQVDYITVNKVGDKTGNDYTFIFHINCYAEYILKRYRSVHLVNNTAKMIQDYKNWGKKIIDKSD